MNLVENDTSSIIYVVRHGECMGNITRKILAPDEAVLTDNGKLQAKLLGQLLRDEKFTIVETSDYPRALETTKIILSQSNVSPDTPLSVNVKLREKNCGIFEGSQVSDLLSAFINSGKDFLGWSSEGGETREDVECRIESFLNEIFALVDNNKETHKILAVTHCGIILHLLKYLSETPTKYKFKNWIPEYYKLTPNTGYFKIAIQKNPPQSQPRELEVLKAHGNEHLLGLGEDALHKFTLENETMKSFKGCVQQ